MLLPVKELKRSNVQSWARLQFLNLQQLIPRPRMQPAPTGCALARLHGKGLLHLTPKTYPS